jgi:hypothetical protein
MRMRVRPPSRTAVSAPVPTRRLMVDKAAVQQRRCLAVGREFPVHRTSILCIAVRAER